MNSSIKPLTFLLITFLSACSSENQSTTLPFAQDLPLDDSGKPDLIYSIVQDKATKLGLDSISNGYDSLQIRLWYEFLFTDQKSVLTLVRHSGQWTGDLVTYSYEFVSHTSYFENPSDVVHRKLTPKSGWTGIMKKIDAISTLPNMSDIPTLEDGYLDGTRYHIEVATKSSYRFYTYHIPDQFPDHPETRSMLNILETLKAEMGVEWKQR